MYEQLKAQRDIRICSLPVSVGRLAVKKLRQNRRGRHKIHVILHTTAIVLKDVYTTILVKLKQIYAYTYIHRAQALELHTCAPYTLEILCEATQYILSKT